MTPSVEDWGIDIDAIEKGDTITREQIAAIYGVPPTDCCKLNLIVVDFEHALDRELRNRGKVFTLKIKGGDVAVLPDAGATRYNGRCVNKAVRGIGRALNRLQHVDREELTDNECVEHDQRTYKAGRIYKAIKEAKKEIRPIPCERSIPRAFPKQCD
jgi:hypothetical protein